MKREKAVHLAEVKLRRFFEFGSGSSKERTARLSERLLRKALPRFGSRALSEIQTSEIAAYLDKLPAEHRNTFAVLRLFFRFATSRRYIAHSPLEGLQAPKAGEKDRILSQGEIIAVWRAAESIGYPFGKIVQLLITSGQRVGQIAALRAQFIDTDARLIKWPPSLMKNNRPHQIPYADLTASIIGTLPIEGLLFPARGKDTPFNGFSKSTAKLYKLCNLPPWSLHDLRRTYASALQAQGVRLEVTERLLSHVTGSLGGIVGLYQRHSYEPEMRQACTAYEQYLSELVAGNVAG
jgi:integrase